MDNNKTMEASRAGEKRAAANDESDAASDENKRQKPGVEAGAEQRELEEKRRQYFMTYGVSYGFISDVLWNEIPFKTEALENDSLLGKYNLVFYASQLDRENIELGESDNAELISRTARGTMELSMKEWNDRPAVFGTYAIDTRKSNGEEDDGLKPLGNYTSASFVETVTDWTPESAFRTLPVRVSYYFSSHGRKDFVLDRHPYSGVEWWKDLTSEPVGDPFCGASIKIVSERHPLYRITQDLLRGNHYGKRREQWRDKTPQYAARMAASPNSITREEINRRVADRRMDKYRDGSNSWMCQHLDIPEDVAFKIRQFVKPPPIFFVEEGDLVLGLRVPKERGWTKTLVFRKAG